LSFRALIKTRLLRHAHGVTRHDPFAPFYKIINFNLMKKNFHIQWHITNRCNIHCRHCYQDDFSERYDLDGTGLIRVADNFLSTIGEWKQMACIHLTGGEPLLNPEMFPLLCHLAEQPAVEELGIITNGLLLDQQLIRRLEAIPKLKKIKISLDGPDPETNDAIRPMGTFHKVMQALSLFDSEREFEVLLMFTAMKRNYKSLPALIRLCEDLGMAGLIIERFIPWGQGTRIREEALSKDNWKEFVENLWEYFSGEIKEGEIYPYQAFQINLKGREPELLGASCVLGVDGFCIMPGGDVFPCRRFPVAIGNLLQDSLNKIWVDSEILRQLREKRNFKGRCGSCAVKNCRGCRSLAFSLTGDYLEEDPHCLAQSIAIG